MHSSKFLAFWNKKKLFFSYLLTTLSCTVLVLSYDESRSNPSQLVRVSPGTKDLKIANQPTFHQSVDSILRFMGNN